MKSLPLSMFSLMCLAACAQAPSTKAQDHNSSRSNKTASIIAPPDSLLPLEESSAAKPSCVEVQITAGDEDDLGRAAGDPIHGVDVKLGSLPEALSMTATTDDDGVARFCALRFSRPGAFVLTAQTDDSSVAVSAPVLVKRAAPLVSWVKQPANGYVGRPLRSADGSCPQVSLRKGLVQPGGVDAGNGLTAYRAGDPIHGVDVKLGNSAGALVASATTDADGLATFCDIVPQRSGSESYEPWTFDNGDDATVSNPLFEQSGTAGENPLFEGGEAGTNPLFEGRPAVSSPVYVSPTPLVVAFTRQAGSQQKSGEPLAGESCPVVSVFAAAGRDATGEELSGAPAAGVEVSVDLVPPPEGAASVVLTVTTGSDGSAALCGPIFSQAGAYNLRARAVGARAALSHAVSVAP